MSINHFIYIKSNIFAKFVTHNMLLYVHFSGGNDMKRRKRLYRKNKQKKLIIIFLCTVLCFMVVGYSAFSTRINLTAKGNIKDKSRVIQRWNVYSDEDFHTDFYKENIVSVTFLDNVIVPSNAVEKWDVSESKDHGVMAYVIESTSETGKYDLYIEAKGGVIANANSSYLFDNFTEIKSISFDNNFDTSTSTDMSFMFHLCHSLTKLDLSGFDTSNVTTMQSMFNMWDAGNTASELIYLDVSSFDTSNVTNMRDMFADLLKLTSLDVSHFNTGNVTDMWHMFYECASLTSLDVSNFDTKKVTNMEGMFCECRNLSILNLCSFDVSGVTNSVGMFKHMTNLNYVYVNDDFNIGADYLFANSNISSVTKGMC